MEDDETPEAIVTDEVNEAPDEVTIEGDTTVIVETPAEETGGDAVEAVTIETNLDHEQRITRLESEIVSLYSEIGSIRGEVAEVQLDAEILAETDDAIIEATDEAIVETVEGAEIEEGGFGEEDEITTDAIEPVSSKVHPMFRSFADWRNR